MPRAQSYKYCPWICHQIFLLQSSHSGPALYHLHFMCVVNKDIGIQLQQKEKKEGRKGRREEGKKRKRKERRGWRDPKTS